MFGEHWMQPASGSLLDRWWRRETVVLPPGGFQCGLRLDEDWRYAISTIEVDELLFGPRPRRGNQRRYRLYIAEPMPTDAEVEPKPDFLAWNVAERGTDTRLQIAVSRRDAYKLLESRIMIR